MPRGKRVFDVTVAALALLLAGPLIMIAALAIAISGNEPFYRQSRLGRNGRTFTLYKLRTMCEDADVQLDELLTERTFREEFASTGRLTADPRVTRLGRFLRRYGIDELPQLINVLRGDMSLVGPRPRTLRWLALGEARTVAFHAYYSVDPGITGTWQVISRRKPGDSVRLELDAEYAAHHSFTVDLRILAQTLPLILTGR